MNRPNAEDPQPQPARGQEYGGRRAGPAYRTESNRTESNAAPWSEVEMDRLREVGRNLSGQFDEQVRKRPYAVVGAAAGLGFVAGSILGSRLGQVLLAAGVGYAAKRVLGEDFGLDRIQAGLERLASETDRKSGRT